MKHRRNLKFKKERNWSALKRYLIWAVAAAIGGGGLSYLLFRVIGQPNAEIQEKATFLHKLPSMMLAATLFGVLALLFFGFRAWLMGIKPRNTVRNTIRIRR